MSIQLTIEKKITGALSPSYLSVSNESHMHSVPPGSESHFKLIIVSQNFEGMSRIRRHQTVNKILKEELSDKLHALSMEALTKDEWECKGKVARQSPECLGGNKQIT